MLASISESIDPETLSQKGFKAPSLQAKPMLSADVWQSRPVQHDGFCLRTVLSGASSSWLGQSQLCLGTFSYRDVVALRRGVMFADERLVCLRKELLHGPCTNSVSALDSLGSTVKQL